jgi:hypothetical protein
MAWKFDGIVFHKKKSRGGLAAAPSQISNGIFHKQTFLCTKAPVSCNRTRISLRVIWKDSKSPDRPVLDREIAKPGHDLQTAEFWQMYSNEKLADEPS